MEKKAPKMSGATLGESPADGTKAHRLMSLVSITYNFRQEKLGGTEKAYTECCYVLRGIKHTYEEKRKRITENSSGENLASPQ